MQNHADIFPKVVPADREVTVAIALPPGAGELTRASIEVDVVPRGRVTDEHRPAVEFDLRDRFVDIRCRFPAEQLQTLCVRRAGESGSGDILAHGRVYSLEPDLYALRPYKGDLHMHSNRSDGRDEPSYVAAACRRIGLDFMALTDHHRYGPSLEAIDAYNGLDLDLRMFPGEEVHAPESEVHIINFGGAFSVNDLFEDRKRYEREVTEVERGLAPSLGGEDRRRYASALWCYRKINEAGGMSIFCHPYWLTRMRDNVSEPLMDQHLRDVAFDAFELLGGFHLDEVESNIRQLARYHEERAKGRVIPVVGVSDAHGCDTGKLFGWYYTVVFAASCDLENIVDAVKSCRAVAVEALPGVTPRAHGPYRLVNYAQFLLREYFPLHDALCRREGELMAAYSSGNEEAATALSALKGQTARLIDKCWA